MVDLNFIVAFTSGAVSFFAPCVVPLLPAYVGYVTGVSLDQLKRFGMDRYRKTILISSLLYILGFSLIFVILGATAAGLGGALRHYSTILQRVGGILMIIFGLDFAGLLPIRFLAYERKFTLPTWAEHAGYLRPLLLGFIFGLAWTPCVGAVLGSILVLAANTGIVGQGAMLLFVYSLGISVPFLIVSMSLASVPQYLKMITKNIHWISIVAGLLLAGMGVLLLTDTYKYLNAWLFEIAFRLGYEIK